MALPFVVIRRLLIPAFAVAAAVAVAAAEPRAMSPVDFVELVRLHRPLPSPDGRYVLYQRRHVDWPDNKRLRRFLLLDRSSGQSTAVLEPESGEDSVGDAIWYPDSSGFVAILKRQDDDYKQVYRYDLDSAELNRFTEHGADIEDLRWQSDGRAFYFRARAERGPEAAQRLDDDWAVDPFETPPPGEIWRVDIDTAERHRVVAGDFDVARFDVSADGSALLVSRGRHSYSDPHERELWLYPANGGPGRRLTSNRYAESAARLSPDSGRFAFMASVNENGEQYYEDNLFVQELGAERPQLLFGAVPMEVQGFAWSATGDALYVLGNTGVSNNLFRYDVARRELIALTSGDHDLKDWAYAAGAGLHALIRQSAASPGEVALLSGDDAKLEDATQEYAGLGERFELPQQTVYRWQGRGGQPLEGILALPAATGGKPVALVTITHGGPRSSARFGSWNASRYVPVLTGAGYGVFLPNHRGGTGYGDDFMRDMVGNYFRHAHLDVLDGIDALVQAGIADPEALLKKGWSAGGHMTNKLITVTDRFKVAASGAGASEWVSMYAESDARHNRTVWFGGAPWQPQAPLSRYREQSPLPDAWRVTTPTLFIVGEKDVRVPPTQSIAMHRAVRAAGAETELYILPGQKHGISRPSLQLFRINTELAWFDRHARDRTTAPVYPALPDADETPAGEWRRPQRF
ncbi:MAG: prolyl oligopeptidase family serine peptidase [Pseudomonadota bacterium]